MEVVKWWQKYVGVGSDLLYDPSQDQSNPLWDELAQATAPGNALDLTGIESGAHQPAVSTTDPFESDLDTQLEIQKKRSTGFNTFIIAPNLIDPSANACQLELGKIFQIYGYDGENAAYGTGTNVQKNPWRTLTIPASGNFLRIDWAPNRSNFLVPRSGMTNPATDSQNFTQSEWPAIGLGVLPSNILNGSGEVSVANEAKPFESNPGILIQFENSSAPVLVGKMGEKYKTPFSQILLHFKSGCPRFIVTTGFNSDITQEQDNRQINSDMAMGPGNGLWTHPIRHCQPFCANAITINNGGAALPASLPDTNSFTLIGVNAAATTEWTIFTLPTVGSGLTTTDSAGNTVKIGYSGGVGVGWLTGFTLSGFSSAAGQFFTVQYKICILGKIRTTLLDAGLLSGAGAAGTVQNGQPITKMFDTPIRFLLRPGERLEVAIRGQLQNADYDFTLNGYVYGNVVQATNMISATNTGWVMEAITEGSYPQDFTRAMFWQ